MMIKLQSLVFKHGQTDNILKQGASQLEIGVHLQLRYYRL